jgi:hypothetical protein
MDNQIQDLIRRIDALEKWKAERIAQQITFPLDEKSQKILNKYFLTKLGNLDFTNSSGQVFRNIMLKMNDRVDVVSAYTTLFRFSVNTTSNKLLIGQDVVNLAQGSFQNDQQIWLQTTDTLPAPLSDAVPVYVVNANASGTEIQVSSTLGGAAIDITNVGVGEHYTYLFT